MPNKKISQLDQITSVAGTEVVPVVQGGVVKRTTPGAFTGRLKELARAANAAAIQDAKELGRSTLIDGLSAGAVMQQDLKAVSTALHRSPNAVTAMFIYDTSKDSDGGAWTKRCQHTSWYNEPLAGRWLGAHSSELMARLSGAQLSNELVTNGTFDSDTSGWGGTWYNGTLRFQNISTTIGQTVYGSGAGKTYLISWSQKILSGSRTRIRIRTAANNSDLSFEYWWGTQDVSVVVSSSDGGITFNILSEVADDFTIDNISIKEIVSLRTTSNDYYQNTTDGKFYRLYKNLLQYSNDFTNAVWGSTANITRSLTTSTTPEGNVATLISKTSTGNAYLGQTINGVSGTFSISVVAKAGTSSILTIHENSKYNGIGYFDLSAGTATKSTAATDAGVSITSLGGGWYRCSVYGITNGNVIPMFYGGTSLFASEWTVGATLLISSAQLEYGTSVTAYEHKTIAQTRAEIFRGNKAEFPSLVGVVAEAGSVTLYDLTEAGMPMWMRFLSTAANSLTARALMGNNNINALSAISGLLVIGNLTNSGYQGSVISMPGDTSRYIVSSGSYMFDGGLSERNIRKLSANGGGYTINSTSINSIATATLTDAPVDSNSGLQAVTVAVATSGGISLIKNGTTVYNSTQTLSFDRVYLTPKVLIASRTGDSTLYYYPNPANISANFTLLTEAAGAVDFNQGNTTALALENRSEFARSSGAKLQLIKHNETIVAKGAAATITPTYNTGYMVGDIKRSYLTSVAPGTVSSTAFAARSLFLDDTTKGIWLDPSDMDTMYQNINGSAVTGVEQLVGLVLDKSKGLPRGPELVTNGSFEFSTTGWNSSGSYPATITIVNNAARITATGAWGRYIQTISGLTVGKLYAVSAYARVVSGGSFASIELTESSGATGSYGGILGSTSSSSFTKIGFCFRATLATHYISIGDATSTLNVTEFDNISVREIIAGNHAYAPSDAARPTLSARYNLLTKTEQFDDATGWDKTNVTVTANASIAPDGNTSADKIIAAATSSSHLLSTAVGTGLYTFSFYAKAAEYSAVSVSNGPDNYVHFNLASGSVSSLGTGWAGATITNVGNGWWLCSATNAASKSWGNARIYLNNAWQNDGNASGGVSFVGDGTSGVYVWGASLVPADQAGLPYQRVNTATDYDSDATKFPRYLKFSGAQSLQTNSIDFAYTDKMFVSAGVRKLSDPPTEDLVVGLGSNGSDLGFEAQMSAYFSSPKGPSIQSTGPNYSSSYVNNITAPTTKVYTGLIDRGQTTKEATYTLRLNGSQQSLTYSTYTDPTGNFGKYPLYIGARGGSSLWFNGQLSQLLIAGRAVTTKQIQDAENYIEQKTYGTYPEFLVDASGNQVVDALGNPLYANVTYQY